MIFLLSCGFDAKIAFFRETVNFFAKLYEQNQACLNFAIARTRLLQMNFFAKSNEQKTSLLVLCHDKKKSIAMNFFSPHSFIDKKESIDR